MYDTCNGEGCLLSNVFHAPAGFCAQGSRPVCISYLQGTRFRPSIRRPGRSVPVSSFAATPMFGQPFSTTRLPETEVRIYGDGVRRSWNFLWCLLDPIDQERRPHQQSYAQPPKILSVCSLTYHNDQRVNNDDRYMPWSGCTGLSPRALDRSFLLERCTVAAPNL